MNKPDPLESVKKAQGEEPKEEQNAIELIVFQKEDGTIGFTPTSDKPLTIEAVYRLVANVADHLRMKMQAAILINDLLAANKNMQSKAQIITLARDGNLRSN